MKNLLHTHLEYWSCKHCHWSWKGSSPLGWSLDFLCLGNLSFLIYTQTQSPGSGTTFFLFLLAYMAYLSFFFAIWTFTCSFNLFTYSTLVCASLCLVWPSVWGWHVVEKKSFNPTYPIVFSKSDLGTWCLGLKWCFLVVGGDAPLLWKINQQH